MTIDRHFGRGVLRLLLERIIRSRGWGVASLLVAVYAVVEVAALVISGDIGSMLFVTWHFLVAPALAAILMILTLLAAMRATGARRRVVVISSVVIELFIIWIAFTGDPGLMRFLSFR